MQLVNIILGLYNYYCKKLTLVDKFHFISGFGMTLTNWSVSFHNLYSHYHRRQCIVQKLKQLNFNRFPLSSSNALSPQEKNQIKFVSISAPTSARSRQIDKNETITTAKKGEEEWNEKIMVNKTLVAKIQLIFSREQNWESQAGM